MWRHGMIIQSLLILGYRSQTANLLSNYRPCVASWIPSLPLARPFNSLELQLCKEILRTPLPWHNYICFPASPKTITLSGRNHVHSQFGNSKKLSHRIPFLSSRIRFLHHHVCWPPHWPRGKRIYDERTKRLRFPLTAPILLRLVNEVRLDEEGINIKSALCVAFAVFLWSGEFTWDSWSDEHHKSHLSRKHLSLRTNFLTLTLPGSKTDPIDGASTFTLPRPLLLCVRLRHLYNFSNNIHLLHFNHSFPVPTDNHFRDNSFLKYASYSISLAFRLPDSLVIRFAKAQKLLQLQPRFLETTLSSWVDGKVISTKFRSRHIFNQLNSRLFTPSYPQLSGVSEPR